MNLASIIEGHPDDAVALISRNRPTTYVTLRRQVGSLRAALAAQGVGVGDRVGLLFGNERYFVVAYLAVVGLGAIAVPLNPTSPSTEIGQELATVGAIAVMVGPMSREAWQAVDPSLVPTIRIVVATSGHTIDGALTLDDYLDGEPLGVTELEPGAVAALLFTSGTAGSPKAAMLTHGSLLANINQSRASRGALAGDDVVFGVLPLFHIFGLNVVLGLTLAAGGTVVLVQRFDPSTALDTIRDRGVTVIPGAPPMWVAWTQFLEADPGSFAHVRLALTGAAKMPEEVARTFETRFGLPLREGYGLTEASPVVTSSVGVEPRIGTIGVPLPGVTIRLVDESGDDALDGDSGELWVKGPNVFAGYWDDPEATARALTPDGWLRTGDIAIVGDGYLSIVDRAKDLVIVSGFNVYPTEVEDVLAEATGVREVAVVGVPHPHTGEAVKAFVVAEPGANIDEEQLIQFCGEHLARYKCPTKILFVDALPHGLGGKLLRRELR
ncbi:MAG: AMP-binding protein [Acidimicrobiales bacterium]